MAKIFNVDFKNKRLEYTWEDEAQKKSNEYRQRIIGSIDKSFKESLHYIGALTKGDIKFQKYCAIVLRNIVCNLRSR